MLQRLRDVVAGWRGADRSGPAPVPVATSAGDVRSMPGQAMERARFLYAQGPNALEYLVQYALCVWVYTAVNELATDFAAAPLDVWYSNRPKKAEHHGILDLLGAAGRPNPDQDRFEFLEQHFSSLILAGNSYWYWYSASGGAPTAVYNLPPECMYVVPGRSEVIGHYVMRWQGQEISLSKESVTHFRRYNPFSRYYGLSALEALRVEVTSDRNMAEWNRQFFGNDVFAPAGLLVLPSDVDPKEKTRIEEELEGKHGPVRRTGVLAADAERVKWIEAGLRHHDLDFHTGRLLSRQAVYEAIGLPLGLYSESSTEAHAKVAERLKLANVYKHHARTAIKVNADALPFWPRWSSYEARFRDVRKVDWQMEKMKLDALRGLLTVNEIREQHLEMAGIEGGDELQSGSMGAWGGMGAAKGRGGDQQTPQNQQEADNADEES